MKIKLKEQTKRTSQLIFIWVLIGIAFGLLYHFLPGSLINESTGEEVNNLLSEIYFSFITILTIGYGDIAPMGLIRILTIIEGLIGWVLFGIIVYQVVSVKQEIILQELHNLSNEQYSSRIKNFLFISNTNLTRFIKEINSKKRTKEENEYELSIISTTLSANIEDASKFLFMNKELIKKEMNQEKLSFLTNAINICSINFIEALKLILNGKTNSIILENINKIISNSEKIYENFKELKNKDLEQLKRITKELKEIKENDI